MARSFNVNHREMTLAAEGRVVHYNTFRYGEIFVARRVFTSFR